MIKFWEIKYAIKCWWLRRKARKAIPLGSIYEDCSGHPMVAIRHDFDGDLTGVSMFTGRVGCCSYWHCGPVPLTYKQAMEMVRQNSKV